MTVTVNNPPSPNPNGLLLIAGVLILSALPLALPQTSIALYWRVLGYSLLGMGVLYAFFLKDVLVTTVLSISFAAMFEAPIKYLSGERIEAAVGYVGRDLLLYTLVLSLFLGWVARNRRNGRNTDVPPVLLLLICFLLNLLVQCFNPESYSPFASFLNSRLFWEMIPLYFLGYYFLRSARAWRVIFATFAIMASLNGAVAVYQSAMGPEVIAGWGPGYKNQIYDQGRTLYANDGELTFRPLGLGADMGFSGALGLVATPMLCSLLFARRDDRQEGALFSVVKTVLNILLVSGLVAGTVAAIIIAGSRSILVLSILSAGISLVFFTWKTSKIQLALGVFAATVIAVAAIQYVTAVAPYFAERYTTIKSAGEVVKTFESENRLSQVTSIPLDLAIRYPLGGGLDNIGPGAQFANQLAGSYLRPQRENTENNLNFSLLALGIPGVVIWMLLHANFLKLGWQARNQTEDAELRTFLTGGLVLMIIFVVYWPFGNLFSFPQNVLFWLIPGMMMGTAAEQRRKRST